jgi:hypothetical protein
MRRKSTSLSLALSAALLLGGQAARGAADRVTFRFAPPLDKTYLATSKVVSDHPTGRGKSHVNETEIVSRLRASRAGQRVQQTFSVVSAANKMDGSVMENPLFRVLPGLDLTFAVGADGQILELVDFPALLAQMKKTQAPERVEAASPFFTPEALLGRRRAAANPLVAGLAGKTLGLGETSAFPGNVTLPTGETFPVRYTATLKGREKTADCDCVRVDFKADPIAQTGKPADYGARAQGTALIDPATMLTWALRNEEKVTLEQPGDSRLMTISVNVDDSLAPNH